MSAVIFLGGEQAEEEAEEREEEEEEEEEEEKEEAEEESLIAMTRTGNKRVMASF